MPQEKLDRDNLIEKLALDLEKEYEQFISEWPEADVVSFYNVESDLFVSNLRDAVVGVFTSNKRWQDLDERERKLLVKLFGQPVDTPEAIRLDGYGRGERCLDN